MQTISLPKNPKYIETGKHSGKFVIEGCYPGYGTTLGNTMRRVLLSSLEGVAVTSVKIKGILHEFSTIDGVMEDVVQIILNLKKVRFKMHSHEPIRVSLSRKGEGEVTAKEIKCSSGTEVINTNQLIATITDKKTEVNIELEISKGLGYVPVEQQEREEKEVGVIAMDAVYTPVRRVNYSVENMRVGKRTDYDRITMEIVTDGSISPQEAFKRAVQILVDQFSALFEISSGEEKEEAKKKKEKKLPVKTKKEESQEEAEPDPQEIKVEDLKVLSTRTLNVLDANKISKVKDIVKFSENELDNLEGMGQKGIKEIKKAIGSFGLILKSSK